MPEEQRVPELILVSTESILFKRGHFKTLFPYCHWKETLMLLVSNRDFAAGGGQHGRTYNQYIFFPFQSFEKNKYNRNY